VRLRSDLGGVVERVFRKRAEELPARILAETDPKVRAKMEEQLAEILEALEAIDEAGPQ